MAKTASDLADQIGALAEDLIDKARMEVRRDIADELRDMIKAGEDHFRGFLSTEGGNYLPGTDASDWVATPDFYAGVRFVIAALKDKNFDY